MQQGMQQKQSELIFTALKNGSIAEEVARIFEIHLEEVKAVEAEVM